MAPIVCLLTRFFKLDHKVASADPPRGRDESSSYEIIQNNARGFPAWRSKYIHPFLRDGPSHGICRSIVRDESSSYESSTKLFGAQSTFAHPFLHIGPLGNISACILAIGRISGKQMAIERIFCTCPQEKKVDTNGKFVVKSHFYKAFM